MSTVLSVVAALLVLSFIVMVHELGHYIAGRVLGFTIVEFAIGMGPVILKKAVKGIRYALRLLPIGGSCMFLGEDEEAKDGTCFNAQKAWKRFIVILAGPVMNVVLAVVLSLTTLFAYGNTVFGCSSIEDENGAAARAGMQAGDVFVSLNGVSADDIDALQQALLTADPSHATMIVERDGQQVTLDLTDLYDEEFQTNRLGVMVDYVRVRYGFARSVGEAFKYVFTIVKEYAQFFKNLVQCNVSSNDVAGPVGTISYISTAVRYGFETVLRLGIVINISLAIMNLLPLPALDGGRLVFILIEWIRGKPVPRDKEGLVHFIGIILLFALMILLTIKDAGNLIGG